MTTKEIKSHCKKAFATHKATLIQDTDRYFAADYRRADGSGDYYVNFIVDKERGSLIISGDLGDCIATWHNPLTPQKLNGYIRNNEYYFIKKIQCSTNLWRYNLNDAYAEIHDMLTDGEEFEVPDSYDYLSESEFFDELREEVVKSYDLTEFHPTQKLWDMVTAVYPDCESLHRCGRSLDLRIYLWLYAFDDVCRQIFEERSTTTNPDYEMVRIGFRVEKSEWLKLLTEREAHILVLRYGLDGFGKRTYEQIGREYQVTRERIRQIVHKARRKLRIDYWSKDKEV